MVCPFIDSDDARCGENLKLDRLDYAVSVCADDFTKCEIFWEKMSRIRDGKKAERAPVA